MITAPSTERPSPFAIPDTVRDTKRRWLSRMGAQWRNDRSSFEPHWRELAEQYAPRRTRFFVEDKNRGEKRMTKIINEAGLLAARTLRAGMMSGITSPARPWRRLTTPDPELAEFGPVKRWLHLVNQRMTTMNLRSNFYNVVPLLYGDMGTFATGAIGIFDDEEDLYRYVSFPVGSYWLAVNHRNVVDTFMRELQMTVRQLVTRFGDPTKPAATLWSNFSPEVKQKWDKGEYDTPINVTHVILPNPEWHPRAGLLSAKHKRFADLYYEGGTASAGGGKIDERVGEQFLRESGFDLFPIMAPRWEVTGEDTWGTTCPGMEALPSTKELQKLMKDKATGLKKQINPPLMGPTSLKTQKPSLISGDVTYLNVREGQQGLKPIHETLFSHEAVRDDIHDLEERISRVWYEPMFMMLDRLDGIQPRNERELADRHEEKILQLGPVLERTNDEFLDLDTDLEFDKLDKHGMLPPPPREVAGMPLKIEYVSIMAKAQKLIGVAGTERFLAFAGNLSGVFPEVRDKIDADQVIDEYADMMNVSPRIVRDDDAVASIRQARSQANQQAAQAQMAGNAAAAAKTLSETDTSTDNALTRMLAGA